MAVIKKDVPYVEFSQQIRRLYGAPIEKYSVFYSYSDASNYAAENPLAYVGQILQVVDQDNNYARAYIIMDTVGTLRELGSGGSTEYRFFGVKIIGNGKNYSSTFISEMNDFLLNRTGNEYESKYDLDKDGQITYNDLNLARNSGVYRLYASKDFSEGEDFNTFSMYGDRKLVIKTDDGAISEVTRSLAQNFSETGDVELFIKQPKFYFRIEYDENSDISILLCDDPMPGFTIHPAFVNQETNEIYDYIYIARDYLEVDNNTRTLTSISNFNGTIGSVSNANSLTLEGYKDLLPSSYSLYGINELSVSQLLYIVEYASLEPFADGITKVHYSPKAFNINSVNEITEFQALSNRDDSLYTLFSSSGTGTSARTLPSGSSFDEVNYRWEKHLWGGPFTCYLDGLTTNGQNPQGTTTIKVNGQYPIYDCANSTSYTIGFYDTFQKDLLQKTGIFVQDINNSVGSAATLPDNQSWSCTPGNTTVGLRGCIFDYEYPYSSTEPEEGVTKDGPGLFQLTFVQTNDVWHYTTAKAVLKGV